MPKPLPRIGVDKLYYCPIISDTESGITYGSPVWMQGVTDIGYKPNPQNVVFAADDGIYDSISNDGEIEVDITVADMLDSVYAYLMGATIGSNGTIVEGNNDIPPEVAVGYRSMKSNGYYRYEWLLKGRFMKPDQTSQTKGGSNLTTQTTQAKFKVINRTYDGNTRRRHDSDSSLNPTGLTDALLASATTGWFSSPDYVPTAPGTAISDFAVVTGGSGELTASWTAATGADSVKIQIETYLGNWEDATTSAALDETSTGATITGLTAGNTYNCRLVVVGGASNGISNEDSAAAG